MRIKSYGNTHTVVRGLIAAIALAGTLLTVQAAPPSGTPGRPFSGNKIPDHARGPEVIEKLGEHLPEVARMHGMTADEFRAIVDHDHSIHLDDDGEIYFICEGLTVEETMGIEADETSFNTSASGLDAFNLSSLPGAPLTIYLDFNGHVTSGTAWNNRVGGADIVTPPYDNDGNPSSFSTTELNNIIAIWKRVAEDYAPWHVNVTTVDPGEEALKRTSSSDAHYGIRVVIGGSSTDWYGTAGGVAYIGSFNWSSDTPCFVFTEQLGKGNVKYTAEATSHEAGHTFSLFHDGTTTGDAYYTGHNDWAPIMGVGYYKPIVQWSKGEYANANNTEDDIAKISNMVPLRKDLVKDDMQTTVVLGLNPITGIIISESDADVYSFQTDGGLFEVSAKASYLGNLDIRLALYDGYGSLLALDNPSSSLNASLSRTLNPGTYYVMVEGTAPGNPNTAYTEYGSIGYYQVQANFSTSQNLPPVAVASTSSPTMGRGPLSVSFSSGGSYDPDGTVVAYDWTFGDGGSSASAYPSYTYTKAGIYTATLVVVDDKGASASDSLVITVTEAQAPLADASATTPLSGEAPLKVNLDGTRSTDPDGTIEAYSWSMSNGGSAFGSKTSYTFNDPGTYTVTLLVTDNEGLTSTDSITISVKEPAQPDALQQLYAINVKVSVSGNPRKGYEAVAEATIVDDQGRTVRGAVVQGEFSGVVNETSSSSTGGNGKASFKSSKFSKSGTIYFEVIDVVMEGYVFVP